jgi:hypothetical protein
MVKRRSEVALVKAFDQLLDVVRHPAWRFLRYGNYGIPFMAYIRWEFGARLLRVRGVVGTAPTTLPAALLLPGFRGDTRIDTTKTCSQRRKLRLGGVAGDRP